jgi:cytochrome c oxidase subunit 4
MPDAHAVHSGAHHPGPAKYALIAAVLSGITLLELAAFYIPWMREVGLYMPALIVMSTIKFSLVAMFYMHLKFDHGVFTRLLVGGVILAGCIMIALLSLFFLAHPPGI